MNVCSRNMKKKIVSFLKTSSLTSPHPSSSLLATTIQNNELFIVCKFVVRKRQQHSPSELFRLVNVLTRLLLFLMVSVELCDCVTQYFYAKRRMLRWLVVGKCMLKQLNVSFNLTHFPVFICV